MIFEASSEQIEILEQRFYRLKKYVQACRYEGYDLFDGLNSRLFKHTPLYRSALFRLALLQFCKRSPVNFRPVLGTTKSFDSSGGAFFMMGHLHMLQYSGNTHHAEEAHRLFARVRGQALQREHGSGWGYNWDWQARAFFSPQTVPNLISSIYCGKAMLDYYQQFGNEDALELAQAVASFILGEMIKFETDTTLCFRYIPGEDAEVHNANLKAAAYLTRIHKISPVPGVVEKIEKAIRFSTSHIRSDYSWPYGTQPFHGWMDNFHTAYNIQSLIQIIEDLHLDEYRPTLEKVIAYYLEHLFTEEGMPKNLNTSIYPVDSHTLAEVLILLTTLKSCDFKFNKTRLEMIESRVLSLLDEFQDTSGYIYYLKYRRGWNKIPYIRWCQGKMFYAMARFLHCYKTAVFLQEEEEAVV